MLNTGYPKYTECMHTDVRKIIAPSNKSHSPLYPVTNLTTTSPIMHPNKNVSQAIDRPSFRLLLGTRYSLSFEVLRYLQLGGVTW